MSQSGMFLYPWDIEDDFEDFVKLYEQTGCDVVAPALSYHNATLTSPRNRRFYTLEEAAVSFKPNLGSYGEIKPFINLNAADNSYKIRQWCSASRKKFTAWTVYFHNSSLGKKYPQCCITNAWGQKLRHALCPANPQVLQYAEALTRDIINQLTPDYIAAESLAPRAFEHGAHHEISSIKLTDTVKWLFSICFCRDCKENARRHGIDAGLAEAQVKELLDKLMNLELYIDGEDKAQIINILFAYPEIFKYLEAYQNKVAEGILKINGIAKSGGAVLQVMPAATPYTINSSFIESFNIKKLSNNGIHYLPLVYGEGEDFCKVKGSIHLLDAGAPVSECITLSANRFKSKDGFLAFVKKEKENLPQIIYYYNYSIASHERLAWVEEANKI